MFRCVVNVVHETLLAVTALTDNSSALLSIQLALLHLSVERLHCLNHHIPAWTAHF